jgi:hypothetical protein
LVSTISVFIGSGFLSLLPGDCLASFFLILIHSTSLF